jgi:hypothetical protein
MDGERSSDRGAGRRAGTRPVETHPPTPLATLAHAHRHPPPRGDHGPTPHPGLGPSRPDRASPLLGSVATLERKEGLGDPSGKSRAEPAPPAPSARTAHGAPRAPRRPLQAGGRPAAAAEAEAEAEAAERRAVMRRLDAAEAAARRAEAVRERETICHH